MVKAHPAYSGTIMNATFQIARDLGWGYLEKLAKQRIMQVQSATDTPKKIALGERAIMVDGAGYLVIRYKEAGQPVDVIYPEEGTPLATGPSAVFKAAPNPNAARLFQNWMHSREAQQILVDFARQYSPHGQTVEKPGVRKLADIKLMKEDPDGVQRRRTRSRSATRRFSRCDDHRRFQQRRRHASQDLGIDLSKPVLLAVRRHAVRADRAADVVAGLLQPSPTHGAFTLAISRLVSSRLSRSADHDLHLATLSASSAAWWPRPWAGWWRAPTCRCGAPCASW